jgi:CubicO group peptidase (beta-lactamase class C family)
MSRRSLLATVGGSAVVGGAAVAGALLPGRLSAQREVAATVQPLAATPVATVPGGGLPLPSTLANDASPQFRALGEALMELMRKHRVPGTALGILADGHEEHAAFGVSSANTLLPAGLDTLFQIGSLTKTYTATAIWHFIEQGKLAIDAPVRTYIPDLRLQDEATAAGVTIGNLLDHTAGWYGDEGTYTGEGDDAIVRFVDERLPQLPQLFPLGKFVSYNNAAFVLLGRLVEIAAGATYNTAMHNVLFGPLGVTDTILDRADVARRPYSDGHYAGPINGLDRVAVQTPLWVPRSIDPAGGIWATTRDVMRYARLHVTPGEDATKAIISAESVRRMQEPVKTIPGLKISMGRNWFIQDLDGVRVIMHNGDTGCGHTVFLAIPQHEFALVLFINNVGAGAALELAIIEKALASYPGLEHLAGKVGMTKAVLAPPDPPTVTMPSADIAQYTGRYASPSEVLTFTPAGSGLEMATETLEQKNTWQFAIAAPPPPPAPVAFLGKDAAVSGPLLVPFVRDDAGRVGWVASGYRLLPHASATAT